MLGASNKVRRPEWPSWIVRPEELPIEPLEKPSENTIRVAAACREPRDLESTIDVVDLSHCRYIVIIDIDAQRREITYVESIRNMFSNIPRRVALRLAYWLVESGVNIVVASAYCHNMTYYLDQSGVTRLIATSGERVLDVLRRLGLIR